MSTDTLAILFTFLIVTISLFGFGGLALLIVLMSRDTTRIPELINRVTNVEKLTEKLSADVNMEQSSTNELWRTADGKYEASSFEELLTKMVQDPNTPFTSDEIESIDSIFNKIMETPDDDDADEAWKKSK